MTLPLGWGGRLEGGKRELLKRRKELENSRGLFRKKKSESESEGRISAKISCELVASIKDYPRMPNMASIRLGGLFPAGGHPDPPFVSFHTLKGLSSQTYTVLPSSETATSWGF